MTDKPDYPSSFALSAAAWILDCPILHIQIISQVESSSHGAFLDSGEPTILYERHLFDRYTEAAYRNRTVDSLPDTYANLSNPRPGGYGKLSYQHIKLRAAIALDRNAALSACSWGLYQILGSNYKRAGFPTLQSFINAMYTSVDNHLRAFTFFIHSDPDLHCALQSGDWHTVGRLYNGRNYMQTGWYDKAMAVKGRLDKDNPDRGLLT